MSKDQSDKSEAKPLEAGPAESPAAGAADAKSEAVETKPASPAAAASSTRRGYYAQAAALALAVGIGWLGGWATFIAVKPVDTAQAAIRNIDWASLAAGVKEAETEAHRAAAKAQILEASLAGLKDSIERSKQDGAARLAQVLQHLDRAQRADQEIMARLAALGERLDKAERPASDPRLTQIAERLERMERQIAAAPSAPAAKTAPAASTDHPAQTGALPEAKPATVEGWVLRDVHRGVGLVEGRNGRLVEIVPGDNLPGVGRVEAIERRGKSWVVVTSRGIITSQQW